MINTICATCEFGVVRLETSTAHFQKPMAFCMLMDKDVGEVVRCTGYQKYDPEAEDEDDDE